MNKVILLGNLVADPELKTLPNNNSLARFRIAVRRSFKNQSGEYESDFLSCTAFGKTAEFIQKYFVKGSRILLEGSVQSRSWDKGDGTKGFATEIVVNAAEFPESKAAAGNAPPSKSASAGIPSNYTPVDDDDQLPF